MTDKSYKELLTVNNDISVLQKHLLRILAIEIYKSLMKINPDFIRIFYTIKPVPYDLRTDEKLRLPKTDTTRHGLNSLIFFRSLLWNNLPTSIKITQGLTDLKNNLRHFRKFHCTLTLIIYQ